MKIFFLPLLFACTLFASELKSLNLDQYLLDFDLQERTSMKIKSVEMLNMVEEGKAIVVDIRFAEEYASWHMPFTVNIPLHELPKRLDELPKDKLIITACPHNDRANLARIYLITKGYNARYLNDGLLKVADYLRGDNAVEFQEELKKLQK
ncbi:MAG: rhodanese-like domain-containing protein [Sulfurimonas sp.]|jgi:rhodanese-related sulfurtransferase|nr:rhodanese-like domain-containing protein [Sulfurimonas sp.]